MKSPSYIDLSESKAWNVARSYSETKIMKWLVMVDDYEILSQFGVNDMSEEFNLDTHTKNIVKLRSIHWLNKTMLLVISNSLKLCRKKDQPMLYGFKKALMTLKSLISELEKDSIIKKRDGKTTYNINLEQFNLILDAHSEIKENMIEPLNNSELIFTRVEDYDPDKLKQEFINKLQEIA